VAAVVAATANGAPTEACNPTASDPNRFCVAYELLINGGASSGVAGTPFDVDFSVANTSPTRATDTNAWLEAAVLRLADSSISSPPVLTRSSELPDDLLIAGGGPCTAPAYTDCGGGHGALVAHLTGGCCPGGQFASGNFGIRKVVNVNPPPAGDYAAYQVTIEFCVNFGTCFTAPGGITQDLEVPEPSGSGPPPPVFTLDTRAQQSLPIPGGATADYALDNFTFHLDGESNEVDGGGTVVNQVIVRLPLDCGTATGTSDFIAGDLVRAVSVSQTFSVTDCPPAPPSPETPIAAPTPTQLDVEAKEKKNKIKVEGELSPAIPNADVKLELEAKKKDEFQLVTTKEEPVEGGGFDASFKEPKKPKKCEVVATFEGDAEHLASTDTDAVKC